MNAPIITRGTLASTPLGWLYTVDFYCGDDHGEVTYEVGGSSATESQARAEIERRALDKRGLYAFFRELLPSPVETKH